ncbi:MAG: hypothetical protein MUD01_16030 [Chloroflexaceae bacterium]|nr:hypothetical protein [Chloroflexaceae bacterium]
MLLILLVIQNYRVHDKQSVKSKDINTRYQIYINVRNNLTSSLKIFDTIPNSSTFFNTYSQAVKDLQLLTNLLQDVKKQVTTLSCLHTYTNHISDIWRLQMNLFYSIRNTVKISRIYFQLFRKIESLQKSIKYNIKQLEGSANILKQRFVNLQKDVSQRRREIQSEQARGIKVQDWDRLLLGVEPQVKMGIDRLERYPSLNVIMDVENLYKKCKNIIDHLTKEIHIWQQDYSKLTREIYNIEHDKIINTQSLLHFGALGKALSSRLEGLKADAYHHIVYRHIQEVESVIASGKGVITVGYQLLQTKEEMSAKSPAFLGNTHAVQKAGLEQQFFRLLDQNLSSIDNTVIEGIRQELLTISNQLQAVYRAHYVELKGFQENARQLHSQLSVLYNNIVGVAYFSQEPSIQEASSYLQTMHTNFESPDSLEEWIKQAQGSIKHLNDIKGEIENLLYDIQSSKQELSTAVKRMTTRTHRWGFIPDYTNSIHQQDQDFQRHLQQQQTLPNFRNVHRQFKANLQDTRKNIEDHERQAEVQDGLNEQARQEIHNLINREWPPETHHEAKRALEDISRRFEGLVNEYNIERLRQKRSALHEELQNVIFQYK